MNDEMVMVGLALDRVAGKSSGDFSIGLFGHIPYRQTK